VLRADAETWAFRLDVGRDPLFERDSFDHLRRADATATDRSRQSLVGQALTRLAAGEHCFSTAIGGRLAHLGWVAMNVPDVVVRDERRGAPSGARWPVPPDSALVYDGWTAPFARGLGLQRRSVELRIADALSSGADAVFGAVALDNEVSRRNALAAGFADVGRFEVTTRLGRRRRRTLLVQDGVLELHRAAKRRRDVGEHVFE
jgi:hypothetical protein